MTYHQQPTPFPILHPASTSQASGANRNRGGDFVTGSSGRTVAAEWRVHSKPVRGGHDAQFSQWMNTFCSCPGGELNTICLAFWLPCVQHGKTHWRLEQVRDGGDPLDPSCKHGLNTACGIHVVGTCIGLGLFMTCLQRNRIRATYGIKGNVCFDCIVTWAFPCCTLIQSDWEVRAREGENKCNTNKKFPGPDMPTTNVITAQPSQPQPMTYSSPDGFLGHLQSGQNNEQACGNAEPQKPHAAVKEQNGQKSRVSSKGDQQAARAGHDGHASENQNSHRWNLAPNTERDMDEIDGLEGAQHQNLQGTSAKIHVKTDGLKRNKIEMTERDTTITTAFKPKKQNATSEVQELSYVHDFSDCPVDKRVLEYYEKEEIRSTGRSSNHPYKHALADCSGDASTTTHVLEPAVITSSDDGQATPKASKGHTLSDCDDGVIHKGKARAVDEHSHAPTHVPDSRAGNKGRTSRGN